MSVIFILGSQFVGFVWSIMTIDQKNDFKRGGWQNVGAHQPQAAVRSSLNAQSREEEN